MALLSKKLLRKALEEAAKKSSAKQAEHEETEEAAPEVVIEEPETVEKRPLERITAELEEMTKRPALPIGMFGKTKVEGAEREARPASEAPVIIEFQRLGDEMATRERVLPLERAEREVKGVSMALYTLPEEERLKKITSEWEPVPLNTINIRYPLIEPYAYVNIKWNEKTNELEYIVIEPPLTTREVGLLDRLKTLIIDLLDINLAYVTQTETVKKYLHEKVDEIVSDYSIKMTAGEYDKILYYIYRNFLGLGFIEPLMQDGQLEDISCDGVAVPIYIYHRKYGSMRTNVVFSEAEDLNKFVTKLAQRCGRHISVAEPLLDGALTDGSRLQATYSAGKDIASKGSTFTIRKFTKDPLTIIDFINFGTIPATMAAYLWLSMEFRNSVLISGGTATGKTSCLNSLSLFLHPEAKIVSIEDTPELNLPHEHWLAKVSRTGYGPEDVAGRRRGEVSMFDLLRAALRERPDALIVGEVRGQEAYVLFQGMATGHMGLATIHAESMDAVINRLITPPISLSGGLLQHLGLVLIMSNARVKGLEVRRVREVVEVLGIDMKTNRPITNQLFRWVPAGDYYEFASDRSYALNKIVKEKGISEKSVWEELERRVAVLEWMKKQGIRYYKDVGKIIAMYYKNPEEVLKKVYGGASGTTSV